MEIKTAPKTLLGIAATLTVSILTPALAHADTFVMCPSGRDGVATAVTTCEFADNVRRAYFSQDGPVVLAYSPVTDMEYEMQCAGGFIAYMDNGMVIDDAIRCVGGNDAVVIALIENPQVCLPKFLTCEQRSV